MTKDIRVLLVEDSPVATTIFKRMLSTSPDIIVVGCARTGTEGLAMIPHLQPHVICTDLHMPQMDGLEFTQEVMAKFPRPILVISSSVQPENTHNVFKLLQAGAVEVFPKPRGAIGENYETTRAELISKIRILSGVAVFTRRRRPVASESTPLPPKSTTGSKPGNARSGVSAGVGLSVRAKVSQPPRTVVSPTPGTRLPPDQKGVDAPAPTTRTPIKIVGVGASTGGPQALYTILTSFPANFPVPLICVQHISEGFLQGLVDWLNAECAMTVKIASPGEWPQPGTIYFPPERYHLELNSQGRFNCSSAPPCSGHRPSVTVTFNSLAKIYGSKAMAILLTGMGRDGADGMQAISRAGGLTIAQDEKTSVVFGMPKEAIALNAASLVLPVNEIAPMILNKLGRETE
ncbi:chemotaxis-specific protein-glutamate methyltransferase CheB [Ancylothrix sp. C2]|uniref:chemotaxis-specific protein-glutamate methyltransferase CheB n=1 Tax=Ancylothrix sp. D3o TaxID=2953691 RepID=UPI0021BAE16E|nr:chemotaxis-specific protein-glutamate methyltransferase CheB [Ancylothrix sp. D3o]MCT7951668.1 chemotaxis-specific protein-glutamate methyltransferase CheB [Ancylothrix sp. D3o]